MPFGWIPAALTGLRLALGPVILVCAALHLPGWLLVSGLLLGMLSDVFDGVIARRLKMVTARLREADSWTDTFFLVCNLAAIWGWRRAAISPFLYPVAGVIALSGLALVLELQKYRRVASYHTYSARLAALALYIALISLLGYGRALPAMPIALALGALCALEQIAITLTLPKWRHDVPSLSAARRMRLG